MKTLLVALLSFGGLGEIRVGMSVAALERVADVRRPDLESESAPCRYVLFGGATVGVRIARERVVAIEVADPRYRTVSGIAVGSSVRDVRAAYGRRASVDGGRFIVRSSDRARTLAIETVDGLVTRIIVGSPEFAERSRRCL